jgi:acetyl esterase/lipase
LGYFVLVSLMLMSRNASAVPVLELPVWSGTPPHFRADAPPETTNETGRVLGVSVPTLTRIAPDRVVSNATAVIVFPGGGYHHLATVVHVGPLAERLNREGIVVFGLKYRTNPPHPDVAQVALEDANEAVRVVRRHAREWGINPRRIGVVGYSAGSNLALNLAAGFEDDASRPDFVAAMCAWAYGKKESPVRFRATTPPVFLCHAKDDKTAPIEMTTEVAASLKSLGVPVEFLIYDTGGHGAFHVGTPGEGAAWPDKFLPWLKQQHLLD